MIICMVDFFCQQIKKTTQKGNTMDTPHYMLYVNKTNVIEKNKTKNKDF